MAANRIQHLLTPNPFQHLNSLLLREARRYVAARDVQDRPQDVRIWTNEDSVAIEVELPGQSLDQIDVSLEKQVITLAVKHPEAASTEKVTVHLKERQAISGRLQLSLPFRPDPEQIQITYARGVLTITALRPAEDLPRQLEVKAGEPFH